MCFHFQLKLRKPISGFIKHGKFASIDSDYKLAAAVVWNKFQQRVFGSTRVHTHMYVHMYAHDVVASICTVIVFIFYLPNYCTVNIICLNNNFVDGINIIVNNHA